MAKKIDTVVDAPRQPKVGDAVRYITESGVEVEARVIEARGDRLTLGYRPEPNAPLCVNEDAAYAPGLTLHWGFPGDALQAPPRPSIPEAGGRPLVVGAAVRYHSVTSDGLTERFQVFPGRITEVVDDSASAFALASITLPGGAITTERLPLRSYSPRFKRHGWSWPSDNVEAPLPRRERFPGDEPRTCPITGETHPASQMIAVGIGMRSRPDHRSNDGLLSPEGADLLRRFLVGEIEELRRFSAIAETAPA